MAYGDGNVGVELPGPGSAKVCRIGDFFKSLRVYLPGHRDPSILVGLARREDRRGLDLFEVHTREGASAYLRWFALGEITMST